MDTNQKRRLIVIISLLILLGVSTYQHGPNMLLITLVSVITSLVLELLAAWLRKEKLDFTAYFISPLIVTLILPHTITSHLWMVALGLSFGLFFAKLLFGGQDKNVFNAESLGFLFLLLSFPIYILNQKTGNAMGEIFVYTCLAMALLLMLFKAISPYTLISYFVSLLGMYGLFYLINATNPNPLDIIFQTNFIFVGVFMVTEPSTGAKKNTGKIIHGFLLGLMVWLINTQSSNREFAAIYAIMLGNTLSPLIDYLLASYLTKTEIQEITL
ncbi:MAG: RnfABCDGE type electron transport complex subunit D [Acholeplasmataceae bacterium]|nr:RnfABCDGE type electron transport complex subunit D [Acholeplasmataceae bacterium]